ncbi:putative NRPS-like enzyme [Xylaria flabelliformis]|nr:putative NRPS-like enzyme [Xylaria flabelliformis]
MAHLTQGHVRHLYREFGELVVIDDIIWHRAIDNPPTPILAYPKRADSAGEYEKFTGQQLNRFVDGAVKYFLACGLKQNTHEVVGILAPSNLDFVVTFFALSRLGYTVLCLSLRIPDVAIGELLKQAQCHIIIRAGSPSIVANIEVARQGWHLNDMSIPSREHYDRKDLLNDKPFVRAYVATQERDRVALIMHSSGSTGLPKIVALTHRNVLTHAVQGAGMDNFASLPLYHMYGISTTLQAIYLRKTAHLFNTSLPLTADNVIAALSSIKASVIHVVPYALGLIVDQSRGLEYLQRCEIVTAAGARTPDQLGDRLVSAGVNLSVVFGTTEAGLLGDSMRRDEGDHSWNYIRIYSNIREFITMCPIGDGQFECVYLQGHPGLSTWNSDDPEPRCWRSKDIFTPHPSIPDAWKYVSRIDDRITLVNGEKVLPLPIEGRVRDHYLVREAVVVGVDRPIPGLLLFRSQAADDLSNSSFLEAVWPVIEEVNLQAEGFSQITPEMIRIIGPDIDYPRTDKGSIIRAQVYKQFSVEIENMYERLERSSEGTAKLDLSAIRELILSTYERIVGSHIGSIDTDFFTAGVDSLKAIQIRRVIQDTLYLGGKHLETNVVYNCRNVRRLADHLFSLSQGTGVENESVQSSMERLIREYSRPVETVLLTGATGSLGAHVLAQMVKSKDVHQVYCFVRGPNPMSRILKSLQKRRLEIGPLGEQKIFPVTADLGKPSFGLEDGELMEKIRAQVTLIVHLAWPVNFNIHLQSFEPQLEGLRSLLDLSLSVRRSEPARLLFGSSISTAYNTSTPASIPDTAIEDFTQAGHTGYAQSKLVAEHMVVNAARRGARAYVLRIGQVVGDTLYGVWNDNEYIPSLIRTALTLKMLPRLEEQCSWLPVDVLATVILQLSDTIMSAPRPYMMDASNPPIFYNVVNPYEFSWDCLLQELKEAGLSFDKVSVQTWVKSLKRSADNMEEDVTPAAKLLTFFETQYKSRDLGGKKLSDDLQVRFETMAITRDTTILKCPPRCIEDGYVKKFLSAWLQKWIS